VLNERSGFFAIRGSDLDRLTAEEFKAIENWLADAVVHVPKKTPQPHQAEALAALLPALEQHDRVSAIMACGTGKTLVALWVAERMGVRNILVLVPSLALLGQTLHEWARETSWPALAHLCVCSDPAVQAGSDEIILRSSDLDFPVTTDSAQVRAFLAAEFDGVKLVFSTYQSAHVVAAGMKRGETFDLAIFDEAHKTAGREGVHFGFALSDKNLAIRKRLFLTATPRHYDLRKRDREGDARLVYSMDAPEIYGPVAHQLTFAEAARRGIICHYRVIISVVTSGMVNDHLLRHGEVLVQGDAVHARHVASQLALQAAVAEHGTGKIFTFHRSVASAAAFTGDGWYRTGDIGRLDEAGHLILMGRIKDIIVLPNGLNVYPEDIENALRTAGVRDSVVIETKPVAAEVEIRVAVETIFSVKVAKTKAMIQKRMMICGSFQPTSSKWWCSGDMRKTRLPVRRNDATCNITEKASIMNRPPTRNSSSSCLIRIATVPSAPPRDRLPTSPMNTWAG